MRSILKITSLLVLPLVFAACAGKPVAIDDRTHNKSADAHEILEDNNNGSNPKLFENEQYRRTPQAGDTGVCHIAFLMNKNEVIHGDDDVQSQMTYDQCLDKAGDKLYSTDKVLAKVHFDRHDGTSVETVINKP